jgi:CRISPR system Cascade subunit CasB
MTQSADRFVDYVQEVCRRDAGRRAALRSGLGRIPERAYRMHAVLGPWLPEKDVVRESDLARERAYYTVASLIAAQTRSAREEASEPPEDESPPDPAAGLGRKRPSLGVTLGLAVTTGGPKRVIAPDSAERRLHLLVRQGIDGVHRHLPALVRQLRGARVPVDWALLLDDLARWPWERDNVAKRWLQDYYRTVYASTVNDKEGRSE